MKKTVVIFDFDGTIANTLDSIINIMNNLSEDFGFRKIKDEDVEYLRGKKPREILKHLGISLFKLPFVVRKVRREINSHIALLSPSVDLLPTLKLLKQNNCQIGIVTTNIEENDNNEEPKPKLQQLLIKSILASSIRFYLPSQVLSFYCVSLFF